ncbi:annexin A7-like [Macrosteles quadrilineatus]|uniref:annexin A7-like n=1 Tax=Macrosteles quadrilineatus TaxID=74068 RepID=UPI0023E1ED5E|nr:annexin A7-like [Macrosteles quadrilineatus]
MAAFLLIVLLVSSVSGLYVRSPRSADGGFMAGGGSGAFSSASSSSSSGTNVAPGPGGYGNFNAFSSSSNMAPPQSLYRGGVAAGASSGTPQGQPPYSGFSGAGGFPGFPGYSPFVPQYGQQYPWTPFPNFGAPFDFMNFLNQYFQALQSFQAQAEAQAQQAAANGGLPVDTNEVGGVGGLATATYGPQGGYGSANVFPKPDGGLDNRFGGFDETPQNSLGGAPVSSVSGNFKPPGGSSFGVFTSSSSGSSDINGKKTSFKQSSIGVNDNGKVTTYTAHDP